jgi:arginyl-tRNA--protein-N-Asp/Glu arginylyltransferase
MIIPDPQKKTLKIPIKIVNGQVQYFYGGELPEMANAIGELVIPAFALLDQEQAEELSHEGSSEMLPSGSELMINVNVDTYAEGILSKTRNPSLALPSLAPKEGFVRVRLEEPLFLWHRGTKLSQLSPCKIAFVDLNEKATSLNHAYTIASKKFETKRTSNTGNVFKHIYYKGKNGWEQLEWLRERLDAKFEQRYVRSDNSEVEPLEDVPSLFSKVEESPEDEDLRIEKDPGTEAEPHVDEHFPDDHGLKAFDERMAAGCYNYNRTLWRYTERGEFRTVPLRIRLTEFKLSKSQKKVLRINADLDLQNLPLDVIQDGDECKLFRRHKVRFGKNAPAEIKLPRGYLNKKFCVFENDELVAASFLQMGASTSYGHYAIFDPEIEWRSLGIFTMLKEIEYAREQGNEFYYLGYAFDKPTLYDYKKRFHGLECYDWKTEKWVTFKRLV